MNYDSSPEEKYLLMLLYAPNPRGNYNDPIRGRTWLQKEMFLLSKNIRELNLEFDEHHYGVFSPVLEVIQLQDTNSDIIQESPNGLISLTAKGLRIAKKLWDSASKFEHDVIKDVKHLLNDMDMWELISFIYSSYPETTINSDVVDEFQKYRLESAIRLFKKGKISLERTAAVAGKSLEELTAILKRRGIAFPDYELADFREESKFLESHS